MPAEAAENRLDLLKQLVPLNTLPEKELSQLLDQFGISGVKKGTFLFKEGDTEAKNIYLLSGKVDLLAGRKIVDTVEAGTETASFALAHRLPREFSCRAKTKVDYISIDSRVLGEMVERCRQDAFKVDDIEADAGDDWMSQLLRSRVFQHIPPGNIQSVMIRMEEVEVKADERVVTQGEEGDYFYMINKGECSVSRTLPNSSESVELARLGPGDSFGEEALLSDSPRGGSVTMLSDGVLLRLSKDDFVDLVKAPLAKYISYSDAQTLVDGGGVWVDVRAPEEYEAEHIPGAINMPLNTLRFESSALDPEKRHVVYCGDGGQATVAAFLLTERGFEVYTLENGLKAIPDEVINGEPEQEAEEDKVVELRPSAKASREAQKKIEQLTAINKKAEAEVKSLQIRLAEMEQTAKRNMVDAEQALELWEERLGELESERDERVKKLADLEKVREQQEAKIAELLEAQGKLEQELKEATGELEQQLNADEELDKIRQEAEARQHELEKKAAELEEVRETQATQLGELEEIRSALESELSEAKAKLTDQSAVDEQLVAVRDEAEARQKELEARIAELEQAQETQANRLSEQEDARSALEAELESARSQLAEQGGADEQLAAVRDEAEARQKELEARIAELEQAQETQANQFSEQEDARSALEAELEAARTQLAEQGGADEQLATVRDEAEARQKELEARIAELEQAQEAQANQLSEQERARSDLETELESARSQLAEQGGTDEQLKELEARLTEIGQAKEALEAELSEVTKRSAAQEEHIASLGQRQAGQVDEDELASLRTQLEVAQQQIAQLENADAEEEIGILRAQMDLARVEAEDKIATLEAELEAVRAEAPAQAAQGGSDVMEQEALRQELESLKRSLEQRQHEVERALGEQHNLDDALEDRDSQIEKLTQELEQAEEESQKLETRVREAEEERLQAETALTVLRERVEQGGTVAQPDAHAQQQAATGGLSRKSGVLGMVAGIVLGVLVLDALMILNGRGEIISGMLGGDEPGQSLVEQAPQVAMQQPAAEKPSAEAAVPTAKSPVTAKPEPAKAQAKAKKEDFSSAIGRVLQERLARGGVGPVMVRLPEGEFEMGSSRSLIARDERPAHRVSLQGFYMSRYEVTFDEYDRFAKTTGRALPSDKGWGRGKRPVINVSWEDAKAYAQWLSKQTGHTYRLPTEAEWEYAAAGGETSLFWWGYDLGENLANCFNCGGQWAGKQTAPVGSFKPNPYGIHNTAGNVMEWVEDCYHPNYEGAPKDGSAWVSYDCKERVARGGAYSKPGDSMRPTKRARQNPASKLPILGIRLVREK